MPKGIVFSQPAILDNKRKMWVPFDRFPLTDKAKDEIKKLVAPAQEVLDEFGVSRHAIKTNYSYI